MDIGNHAFIIAWMLSIFCRCSYNCLEMPRRVRYIERGREYHSWKMILLQTEHRMKSPLKRHTYCLIIPFDEVIFKKTENYRFQPIYLGQIMRLTVNFPVIVSGNWWILSLRGNKKLCSWEGCVYNGKENPKDTRSVIKI